MGDEKRNPDYMEKVKERAKEALLTGETGKKACFKDLNTLDGVLGKDVFSRILTPPSTSTGASILKRKVESSTKIFLPNRY